MRSLWHQKVRQGQRLPQAHPSDQLSADLREQGRAAPHTTCGQLWQALGEGLTAARAPARRT